MDQLAPFLLLLSWVEELSKKILEGSCPNVNDTRDLCVLLDLDVSDLFVRKDILVDDCDVAVVIKRIDVGLALAFTSPNAGRPCFS